MKSLENKVTTIKLGVEDGGTVDATYKDLIDLCIKTPKQGGLDYTDIENRIAISAAIKNKEHKDTLEFEDQPYKYLAELVKGQRWPFWHEDLIPFKNDIIECQSSRSSNSQE